MNTRVAIVGGGPAGIRAAERLVEHGLSPILLDEAPRIGGRIYQQLPEVRGFRRDGKALYGFEAGKAEDLHAAFARIQPQLDYRPGTTVFDIASDRLITLGDGRREEIAYDRLILATGAMDRIMPLPGWTLPGVFALGGAQIALKHQGCAIGHSVVFLGSGPLLYLAAYQYAKAGVNVAAVLTTAPWLGLGANLLGMAAQAKTAAKGAYYVAKLLSWRIPVIGSVRPARIMGRDSVEGLEVLVDGRLRQFDCDAVALGYGLKSESQLAELAGAQFVFDRAQNQWLPEIDDHGRAVGRDGLYLAGDGAGIQGADAAELRGRIAAGALLQDLGIALKDAGDFGTLKRWHRFRVALEQAMPFPSHLAADLPDASILCRCENITAGEVRAAADQGLREINRVKAATRLGMGRCQGRICGIAGAEVLAAKLGVSVDSVGRLRAQPPVKPVPIEALAGDAP
ncbi:FAD/NAD(P)-dependent oxidoreductase [Dongia sedimenti]|uniref:FAD/NAD(P)-binding oxidoreductase n=1 Tax=Dongia sedimenti TaxID=3064282 RepID=A0ABU0YY68_9PROT|nr:FAD/NAD(P)-binding oxidoreductase [Rhodospirillaceae bacterium R-7]